MFKYFKFFFLPKNGSHFKMGFFLRIPIGKKKLKERKMGKILNKIDDARETIEDVIADVLARLDKNTALDVAQKTIITNALNSGLSALNINLSDIQLSNIVNPIVDVGLKTLNNKAQKQLRKKNKKYLERHKNEK